MADNDRMLSEAFARYADAVLADAPQPDGAVVRAIVRRRHGRRIAALAGVIVVLLALPVAVLLVVGRGSGNEPAPPPPVSPSASAEPSPSATSPSPTLSTGALTGGDGAIPLDALAQSTLTFPAAEPGTETICPSGEVRMAGNPTEFPGSAGGTYHVQIKKVVYADLDGDGARETAALISCYVQGASYTVLVFDRDAGGAIRTVGRAIATTSVSGDKPGIKTIWDLRTYGTDAVEVQVGDGFTCCGADPWTMERQWRRYAWNGSALVQTAGPTGFHPVPPSTDLSITGTRLLLGAPVNGVRRGSFTVTFSNKGPITATGVLLKVAATGWDPPLRSPVTVSVDGIVCQTVTNPGYRPTLACHLNPLAAGAQRTLTVRVVSPVANDAVIPVNQPNPDNDPGVSVDVADEQPGVRALVDPTRLDNEYEAGLARSG